MKVTYDAQEDTLRILLCNAPIQASETHRSGLILDYDQKGRIVGLELADASIHMSRPEAMGLFQFAAQPDRPENGAKIQANETYNETYDAAGRYDTSEERNI